VGWVAREGLVRRIVDGALRGRAPVIFGGPGVGKTHVALAAAERLRERGIEAVVIEHGDADEEPGLAPERVALRTGGLALHRALGSARAPKELDGRPIQRVPLVPLLRRDLRAWAAAAGYAFSEDELEHAFRASGGHAFVFSAWLDACRFTRSGPALEARVLEACEPIFARLDRELAHPELAPVFDWLMKAKSASVLALRRATRASKPVLDRLACAGPVSRTLGAKAEIAIACELYLRRRAG
jgi:hypothetical protein